MQTIKSIAVLLFSTIISLTGCGQTATTPPPAKTTATATKAATTATKAITTATKAPSTIPAKSTAKKTTATKTLQKPATAKTTTSTTQTTTIKTPANTAVQTKIVNPVVIQKTEPTIVIPKPETQTQTQTQTTKVQTNTTTTTTTTTQTQTQPQTGGKINTGTGGNTPQQTNTNTNTGTGGKVINGGTGGNTIINTITDGDATNAIKEALMKGVQVGVDRVSVTDGYFGNSLIKIPFPAQVKQVESTLRSVGMGSLIDNAVLSMNRAAESAAKQAGPIFLNGIKQMTVTDAVNIVSNQQPDAATQFLKRTTTESLVSSFKPSIKTALDKTMATKYWGDITGYYNKIPFVSPISTDLPDYVTRKAIDGLFYMVAQEEAKIRKDPMGETSKIIQDVFSKVKF